MNEIIALLKESIEDQVLVKSEKRELKQLINTNRLDKREFDLLRSHIFDIARENKDKVSVDILIDWLENANKLSLLKDNSTPNEDEVFFSPGKQCRDAIIRSIKQAKQTVKICVFTISDNDLTAEILKAHRSGITVQVITDDEKSFDRGSDIQELFEAGIKVKNDDSPYHMHHKFCVIDKEIVITGSYNWTRTAAERNQENVLVSSNMNIIKKYLSQFEKLWKELHDYS